MLYNTILKLLGIVLVLVGFFINRIDIMLLGIFFILLIVANCLSCEAFELSNQIGTARDELKEKLSKDDYKLLASKIKIIGDDSPYIAMDELGNVYNYGDEGFPDKKPDIQAQDWLGVSPDYYD